MRVSARKRSLLAELLGVRPAAALSLAAPTGGAGSGQGEGRRPPSRTPRLALGTQISAMCGSGCPNLAEGLR